MTIPDTHDLGPRGTQPKEQFHFLEPQESMKRTGDTLTKTRSDGSQLQLPPPSESLDQPAPGPGWVEYGSWANDSEQKIISFTGTWQVPAEPAVQQGQVIFISMGLQTTENNSDDLFLPVLQWGPSAAGGGDYWAVSCWYQHKGRITYSKLLRVAVGDTIFGSVVRTVDNEHGTEWTGSAKVEGSTNGTTSVPVIGDIRLAWAFTALEAYSLHIACDQFPASGETDFRQLALSSESGPLVPTWKGTVEFDECNNQVLSPDATEVRLIYL